MDRSSTAYWDALARAWGYSIPLAPSSNDIAWSEAQVRAFADELGSRSLRALMLGVTPSIATMRWPEGTSLVAVDWSAEMIRHVWPAAGLPQFAAPVLGDWRQLPLASASCDAVVGDGCYTVVGSFEEVALINAEVRRVLQPRGLYSLRCFTRPEHGTDVAALFEGLFSGRFPDPLLFRWLLAAAVQGDSRDGVPLDSVWQAWAEHVPDSSTLRNLYGWPEDATGRIQRWKGLRMRFLFPSLSDLAELAAPHFALIECDLPGHEWGELFPRVLMRARS